MNGTDYCLDCEYYIVLQGEDKKYYSVHTNLLFQLYLDYDKNQNLKYDSFVCDVLSGKILLNLSKFAKHPYINIHQLQQNAEIELEIKEKGLLDVAKKYGIEKEKYYYKMQFETPYRDDFMIHFYKKGYLFSDGEESSFYAFVKADKLLELVEEFYSPH